MRERGLDGRFARTIAFEVVLKSPGDPMRFRALPASAWPPSGWFVRRS